MLMDDKRTILQDQIAELQQALDAYPAKSGPWFDGTSSSLKTLQVELAWLDSTATKIAAAPISDIEKRAVLLTKLDELGATEKQDYLSAVIDDHPDPAQAIKDELAKLPPPKTEAPAIAQTDPTLLDQIKSFFTPTFEPGQ